MRPKEEIDADIAHIRYARSVLDERLCSLEAERAPNEPCGDKYLKDRATKKLAAFFNAHGLYNGHDMQLDLVAEVGECFYIFETKSGFVLAIDKWVDRARLFDNGKNRFITCAADEKLNPRIFHPFCLFALPTLERQFTDMLEEDFKKEAQGAMALDPASIAR